MNKRRKSSPKELQLPLLASLLVLKRYESAKAVINGLRDDGISQNSIREAVIQTYLFDGYPTALEGLFLLKGVFKDEYVPPPAEPVNDGTAREWIKRGEAACRIIYRGNYKRLVENVGELSPDLAGWMLMEGYGKVLSRKTLNLGIRELINIAILAVKDYPRQLHSHFRGALNAGVSGAQIDALLRILEPLSPESIKKAVTLWNDISGNTPGN